MNQAESCPLIGQKSGADIPEFCRDHCQPLWEQAMETQTTKLDDFTSRLDSNCPHGASEFCEEFLQEIGGEPNRQYSISDLCMSCGNELGSEGYDFDCPYAAPDNWRPCPRQKRSSTTASQLDAMQGSGEKRTEAVQMSTAREYRSC